MSHMLTNGAIFSTFKHADPLTVRGRSTLKDGVVNERIFRKLKVALNCAATQMIPKLYRK